MICFFAFSAVIFITSARDFVANSECRLVARHRKIGGCSLFDIATMFNRNLNLRLSCLKLGFSFLTKRSPNSMMLRSTNSCKWSENRFNSH